MTHDSMRQALIDARNRGIELPDFTRSGSVNDRYFHYADCDTAGTRRSVAVESIFDDTWSHGECLKCDTPETEHIADALDMVRTATHYGKEVTTMTDLLSWTNLQAAHSDKYGTAYADALYEWRDFCADYREHASHNGLSVLQRETMTQLKGDSIPLAHYGHRLAADVTAAARLLIRKTPLRSFLVGPNHHARPVLYAAPLYTPLRVPDRGPHADINDTTLLAEARHLARNGDLALVEWDLRLTKWTDARGMAATGDYTQLELETALQVYANADQDVTFQDALDAVHIAQSA